MIRRSEYYHYAFLLFFTLIICIASTNRFTVPELTERQDRASCLVRSCNQLVTGRRLRYGRALAIVNNEEYLEAVSLPINNFKFNLLTY